MISLEKFHPGKYICAHENIQKTFLEQGVEKRAAIIYCALCSTKLNNIKWSVVCNVIIYTFALSTCAVCVTCYAR